MRWARQVDADIVRARWEQAQRLFSPLAGWPPPQVNQGPMRFADREADRAEVALALSVVSSRSALWEVQAQIVEYCSRTEADPATQWDVVAGLDPFGETWRYQDGIPGFLAGSRLDVPLYAVTAAARVMSGVFRAPSLDGLGYVVARFAGPDLEECLSRCGEDAACLLQCLTEV